MRYVLGLAGLAVAAVLAVGDDEPRVPFPRPDRPQGTSAHGVVTAVDAESITVRGFDIYNESLPDVRFTDYRSADGKAWVSDGPHVAVFGQAGLVGKESRRVRVDRTEETADTFTLFPTGGGEPVVVRLADRPERRLAAVGPLAEGGYKKGDPGANTYRLADVQVGDRVIVKGIRRGVAEYAETVSIRRRPGGRVPPAPGNLAKAPPLNQPWFHEMMNAEQDLEERGIPLPQGYHDFQRWVHDAPPPREAKPK